MKVVANTRQAQGTGASRRLRHAGKVPGILYGGKGEPTAIEVEHNPLFHALRKERFHASVLDLELDGQAQPVLLRDYQMHPYKPQVLHIDFQRVDPDQKITMRVPLHFVGQENSPAVKGSGAVVGHVLSAIEIACLPGKLPEFIEIDLSELKATDTVKVKDLKLPEGVAAVLHGKENPVVVSVNLPAGATEEAAAEGEAAGAADAKAPAAKAPAAKAPAAKAPAAKAPAAKAPAPAPAKKK